MAELTLDNLDIHTPELYLERGYPFAEWDLLRKEAPVFWYERDDIDPFYAITRHADILEISKHAEVFVNSRRLRLQSKEDDLRQDWAQRMRAEARGWDPDEVADFIFMDDPRHRNFRLTPANGGIPAGSARCWIGDVLPEQTRAMSRALRKRIGPGSPHTLGLHDPPLRST